MNEAAKLTRSDQATVELRLMSAHEVPFIWNEAGPLLEPAVARGDGNYDIYDVYKALVDGRMQLWTASAGGTVIAVMVSHIVDYPRKRVCALPWIGGQARARWWHFMPQVELWARAKGCVALEGWPRKGFTRFLTDWRTVYTVMRKDLV